MHNKDDRTQLLKLCTINSKLIKEKKMEKNGREREREKNLYSQAILNGWQKIVYTVTFCFSLHHHLTGSEQHNTTQPNQIEMIEAWMMVKLSELCMPSNESFTF